VHERVFSNESFALPAGCVRAAIWSRGAAVPWNDWPIEIAHGDDTILTALATHPQPAVEDLLRRGKDALVAMGLASEPALAAPTLSLCLSFSVHLRTLRRANEACAVATKPQPSTPAYSSMPHLVRHGAKDVVLWEIISDLTMASLGVNREQVERWQDRTDELRRLKRHLRERLPRRSPAVAVLKQELEEHYLSMLWVLRHEALVEEALCEWDDTPGT
jgi:hypothetical protein